VILGRGQPVTVGPVDRILTAERLRALYGLDLAIETTPMGRRVVTRCDLPATPAR